MNPYRIESLHLTQVGPFKELELVLPATPENGKAEVHILTGENGTGKTSILEVITDVFTTYYNRGHFFSNHHRIRNESKGIVRLAGLNAIVENSGGGPAHDWLSLGRILGSENPLKGLGPNNIDRPRFAGFAYSVNRHVNSITTSDLKELPQLPFLNACDLNKSIDSELFQQWLINTQARELIARGKSTLQEAKTYRQNISVIERAMSLVVGWDTIFELEDNPFQSKININGQSLSFDEIPDGLKSMVSWLGDLLMRMDRIKWDSDIPVLERPFLLLLDEIDVHLHPAWQRKILPMVQDLFPNAQVIVSTHSPFVVGSVDGAWVHKFVKKDGFSVLDGLPILSEDARSYEYILEEIFGIKERFGIEVEKKLTKFQQLKKQLLKHDELFDESRFRQLIDELRGQSIELDSLIGMELKQLERLTQRSFVE